LEPSSRSLRKADTGQNLVPQYIGLSRRLGKRRWFSARKTSDQVEAASARKPENESCLARDEKARLNVYMMNLLVSPWFAGPDEARSFQRRRDYRSEN
jgi:hypothetical protein